MTGDIKAVGLLRSLADPVRYGILAHLMSGPATVSELVAATQASQSNVSNHLALLRDAELVTTDRNGRHSVYALANATIAELIEAVARAAGDGPIMQPDCPEITLARTCYDHLAGRLGVALFRSLVVKGALRDVAVKTRGPKVRSGLGNVELGPKARAIFTQLGVDIDEAASRKRQFATACSDWTETQPHLGGALGAALQERLIRERWVLRRGGSRALTVTSRGHEGLLERFGIDTEEIGAPRVSYLPVRS